ncbi:MAG: heme-binding protein [Gammaproteobacteria bacterium]
MRIAVAGTLVVLGVAPAAEAVETLGYETEAVFDDVEIRRYAPHLAATARVDADFESAGNRAFPSLFGFIDGANATNEKISMTAPVLQTTGDEGFEVSFVMPRRYARATLPSPSSEAIHIREVPSRKMAVLTYSGRWTQERYERNEARLREKEAELGYRVCGEPQWARHDPPFMPFFLRRNEVLIPVAKAEC